MKEEEEAPVVIPAGPIEDTVKWEKEVDDLFRTLRDPKDDVKIVGINLDLTPICPLHTHVSLKKSVHKRVGIRPMQ